MPADATDFMPYNGQPPDFLPRYAGASYMTNKTGKVGFVSLGWP